MTVLCSLCSRVTLDDGVEASIRYGYCTKCWDAGIKSDIAAESIATSTSGVNRSVDTGKPRYDLVDLGLFRRCAIHMAANVESKGENNWRNASTEDDLRRFRASAFRHFISWFEGEDDEDHAAAVYFNIAGAEYVKEKLRGTNS